MRKETGAHANIACSEGKKGESEMNLKLKYACKIAQLTQICLKSANLYHDNRLIAASFIHLSWLGKVLEETRINVHFHTSPPLIKGPLLAGG